MENQIEKVEFKTSKDAVVVVTAELALSKIVDLDGDKCPVDCCEMKEIFADIEGHPRQYGYSKHANPISHELGRLYASVGKLGLIKENAELVENAINRLKRNPAWIAKQEKIAKNQKEIEAMEARRDASPGYCRKCQSYCYGDCEAN